MKRAHAIGFAILGFAIWIAATLIYRWIGSYLFEGSAIGYWLNVGATGALVTAVALGLMQWRGVEQRDWLVCAICIVLPGMLGEIPVLSFFSEVMSNMQPETAGRYAAFLFAGYALILGLAGFLSATANVPRMEGTLLEE